MPFIDAVMQRKPARGRGASAVFCRRRVLFTFLKSRDCSKQLTLAHCSFSTVQSPRKTSPFKNSGSFLSLRPESGASPLHGEGLGAVPSRDTWGIGAIGSALRLQRRGSGIEARILHPFGVYLCRPKVRICGFHPQDRGALPRIGDFF